MRTYQDPTTGEIWCEVKKGDTTVHRKVVIVIEDHFRGRRSPMRREYPETFGSERLAITLTDMEIIQEQTDDRPKDLFRYGIPHPDSY